MTSDQLPVISPEQYIQIALRMEGRDGRAEARDVGFFTVQGDVCLSASEEGRQVKTLPPAEIFGSVTADMNCQLAHIRESRIHGKLMLDGSRIEEIDAGCMVSGGLWARSCKKLRKVGGFYEESVHLSWSGIREVDSELHTKKNLYLNRCVSLKKINCCIDGDLDARHSGVEEFGGECRIKGDLDLTDCNKIREIGFVGEVKNAFFDQSGIRRIKKEFRCSDGISLADCQFLQSVGKIDTLEMRLLNCPVTDIDFSGVTHYLLVENCPNISRIEAQPAGEVKIERCKVSTLEGLAGMGASLRVGRCPLIREIGGEWQKDVHLERMAGLLTIKSDFQCWGNLAIERCHKLKLVGGRITGKFEMCGGAGLVSLSTNINCGGDVFIHGEGGQHLLAGRVAGSLRVDGSVRVEIDKGFRVEGDMMLVNCGAGSIIRGSVGGNFHARECQVTALGADLECSGKLVVIDCHQLKILNCRAGGKVVVSSHSLERVGPGFYGGRDAEFFQCGKLVLFEGRVDGELRQDRENIGFKNTARLAPPQSGSVSFSHEADRQSHDHRRRIAGGDGYVG